MDHQCQILWVVQAWQAAQFCSSLNHLIDQSGGQGDTERPTQGKWER